MPYFIRIFFVQRIYGVKTQGKRKTISMFTSNMSLYVQKTSSSGQMVSNSGMHTTCSTSVVVNFDINGIPLTALSQHPFLACCRHRQGHLCPGDAAKILKFPLSMAGSEFSITEGLLVVVATCSGHPGG